MPEKTTFVNVTFTLAILLTINFIGLALLSISYIIEDTNIDEVGVAFYVLVGIVSLFFSVNLYKMKETVKIWNHIFWATLASPFIVTYMSYVIPQLEANILATLVGFFILPVIIIYWVSFSRHLNKIFQ